MVVLIINNKNFLAKNKLLRRKTKVTVRCWNMFSPNLQRNRFVTAFLWRFWWFSFHIYRYKTFKFKPFIYFYFQLAGILLFRIPQLTVQIYWSFYYGGGGHLIGDQCLMLHLHLWLARVLNPDPFAFYANERSFKSFMQTVSHME